MPFGSGYCPLDCRYVFPPTTAFHANGLVTYAVNGEIYLLRPIGEPFGYVAQAYPSRS